MPAAKPRRRRVLEGILSANELAFVADQEPADRGFEWLSLENGLFHRDPKSRAALAWRSAQPNALREWIRHHPGTRPRCWWAFSAPEPMRAVVRGRGTPLLAELVCGRPVHWRDWSSDLEIESQAAYLRRHGLLTAGESTRIPKTAFEPERIHEPPLHWCGTEP
jgi:hypothetical protein